MVITYYNLPTSYYPARTNVEYGMIPNESPDDKCVFHLRISYYIAGKSVPFWASFDAVL